MASNSVDFLSYKPHVTPASSTNHKEDIIKARLHELKIAYQIIAQCEHCKDKLINAVKMGANPPEQQRNQNEVIGRQI
jgi:hypothetical protein